mmetsp:Transcript_1311/g.5363  ORF Transcript_1311/g.5363 Transcript_1311/m.5363 type:complete len:384 (+) Transcript_1311:1024-2175(+)
MMDVIARLSGRAPYSLSKPVSRSLSIADAVRAISMPLRRMRPAVSRSIKRAMRCTDSFSNCLKHTISSRRLSISGLKKFLSSSRTFSRMRLYSADPSSSSSWSWNPSPPPPLAITLLPTFDVSTMRQFLKLTTLPWESVRRPSSIIWSRMLNTSGCAFSISSKRRMVKGLRRTASVSVPPWPKPTYPGGAPTSLDTLCLSMYSDMSSRTMLSSLPKYFSARRLVSSVLPTPVGPAKSMDAIGRFGSLSPHRVRLRDLDTALTASSWPITAPWRSWSMLARMACSSSVMRCTGMPLHIAATASISSTVTLAPPYAPSPVSSSTFTPSLERLVFTSRSLSRRRVASSKSKPLTAASFASLTCLSARHISIASMDVALSTSPLRSF